LCWYRTRPHAFGLRDIDAVQRADVESAVRAVGQQAKGQFTSVQLTISTTVIAINGVSAAALFPTNTIGVDP
jgi:hypothetical protein